MKEVALENSKLKIYKKFKNSNNFITDVLIIKTGTSSKIRLIYILKIKGLEYLT